MVGRVMTLKIGVYLTDDVARRFRLALKRSRMTKSALVNEALARFLSPPAAREPGQEVLQALTALAKRVRRLQREALVISETLALFVRYLLMVTPPIPESSGEPQKGSDASAMRSSSGRSPSALRRTPGWSRASCARS
jgi:hypothetical protein